MFLEVFWNELELSNGNVMTSKGFKGDAGLKP